MKLHVSILFLMLLSAQRAIWDWAAGVLLQNQERYSCSEPYKFQALFLKDPVISSRGLWKLGHCHFHPNELVLALRQTQIRETVKGAYYRRVKFPLVLQSAVRQSATDCPEDAWASFGKHMFFGKATEYFTIKQRKGRFIIPIFCISSHTSVEFVLLHLWNCLKL